MQHPANIVARFRRTVAADTDPKLDTVATAEALDMYAIVDGAGLLPGANGYVPTYDWHGACAEAWRWKAAATAHFVTFNADGQNFSAAELHANCLRQAATHEAKRQTGTVSL